MEEEEEGRNGKRADGDVKTSSPSEKTAGQGRSGTTNHDETSEGVERVGGQGSDRKVGGGGKG